MNITLAELQDERQRLTKDFNELKDKIQKVEIDVGTMKSNLNALNGAIMFATNMITKATEREKELMKKDEKKKK